MSATIISFIGAKLERLSPTADQSTSDVPLADVGHQLANPGAVAASVRQLEELDRELQVQAHAINLQIGEVRRRRLALIKLMGTPRSA